MFLGIIWWVWAQLLYLLCAVFAWWHPRFWIRLDVKDFNADGAKQSLGYVFHRQRATWRGVGIGLTSALTQLPLLLHFHPRWWWGGFPFWGVVFLQVGYWTWYFNPALSLARKLDYVDKWHVSWAANASWLDRFVWAKAWSQVKGKDVLVQPGVYDLLVAQRSREIYPGILNDILWGSIVIFLSYHIIFLLFLLYGQH